MIVDAWTSGAERSSLWKVEVDFPVIRSSSLKVAKRTMEAGYLRVPTVPGTRYPSSLSRRYVDKGQELQLTLVAFYII
jgi:hypothetical protein